MPTAPTPEDELLRTEDVARIEAALRTLSPRAQLALRLRYLEGRDISEVADAIGVASVEMRGVLNRALIRLRAALAESGPLER